MEGFLMTDESRTQTRRDFLAGISASLVCAPAVVRAASIMRVRGIIYPIERNQYGWCTRLYVHSFWRGSFLLSNQLVPKCSAPAGAFERTARQRRACHEMGRRSQQQSYPE
jgi:hypothetical protein